MLKTIEYAECVGVIGALNFELKTIELTVKDASDFFKKRQVKIKHHADHLA